MSNRNDLKQRAFQEIDSRRQEIFDLAASIWEEPEEGYKEYKTAAKVAAAKITAAPVIDLLYDKAAEARHVIDNFQPALSTDRYKEMMDSYFTFFPSRKQTHACHSSASHASPSGLTMSPS